MQCLQISLELLVLNLSISLGFLAASGFSRLDGGRPTGSSDDALVGSLGQ